MKQLSFILSSSVLCAVLLVLTSAHPAAAARTQAARGDTARPAPQQPALTPERRKTATDIENFYINQFYQSVSKLGINEDQTLKIVAQLRDYVTKQQMWAARKATTTNRLEQLVKTQGSSDEILDQLDLIDKSENNLRNTRRQFFTNLGSAEIMLTAQQQAKLLLFMRDTDEKVLEFIMRVKQTEPTTPKPNAGQR